MLKIYYILCFSLTLITIQIYAKQNNFPNNKIEKYYEVQIQTPNDSIFNDLLSSGISLESAKIKPNYWIKTIINDNELTSLRKKGFEIKILIDDLSEYYSNRLKNQNIILSADSVPEHFHFGSMGGFYKLNEIYEQMDSMIHYFPNLISISDTIGFSVEERPLISYIIGNKNNNSLPQILFTALHHAREPGGATTFINFLWQLFEDAKNGDAASNYLLNNRQFYFIPVVNPDGYYYNEVTYPNGGGMWRKNRKWISDTTYGIDINRNYGPYNFWNANNFGSSTNPTDETYRGSAPFSEPEIQAMRDYCYKKNFKLAMNFHTFEGLVIYPYGALGIETPDSDYYRAFCYDLSLKNFYSIGRDVECVGYPTRGDSDDWMYLADSSKPKIFSITPELGNTLDGFWPTEANTLRICRENLNMLKEFIWDADVNLRPFITEAVYDTLKSKVQLKITIKNLGLELSSLNSKITLFSLDTLLNIMNPLRNINQLNSNESQIDTFKLNLIDGFNNGKSVKFVINISQNNIERLDTVNIQLYKPTYINLFSGSLDNNWITNQWGLEFDNYLHTNVLSDSPYRNYRDSLDNYLIYKHYIKIAQPNTILEFDTRWQIEKDYDFGVVEVSADSGLTWNSIKSSMNLEGLGLQYSKEPIGMYGYCGNMPLWVHQEFSLSNYTGKSILIRFGMLSDNGFNLNGWLINNIKIRSFENNIYSDVKYLEQINSFDAVLYPQPLKTGENLNVQLNLIPKSNIIIEIRNLLGELLEMRNFDSYSDNFKIEIVNKPAGAYILTIKTGDSIINKLFLISE